MLPVRRHGFTLIEVVVILLVSSVLLAIMARLASVARTASVPRATAEHLAALEVALVQFVMVARRLPCPADGAIASGGATAGLEQRDAVTGDCLDGQRRGVAPWRSLGLPEDVAVDPHFGRITYRVALGLTRDGAMDLSGCDPAASRAPPSFTAVGAAPYQVCAPTCPIGVIVGCCKLDTMSTFCTSPTDALSGRGFAIQNVAGGTVATGAAYVLISHGENRAGAYGVSGAPLQAIGAAAGAGEVQNAAGDPLAAFYVDDSQSAAPQFDDVIARATVYGLAMKAALGPRIHQN